MSNTCEWCGKKLKGRQTRFCSRSCGTCHRVTAWRHRTKKRGVEYLGGVCTRCGYDQNYAAMIFHHPGKKSFGISQSGNIRKWEKIRKELDKCELLCLNCHAEHHHLERNAR